MVLPSFSEARLYYRAALQRFEDAEFLMADDRTTGAVYLAGYGVECILKALVLASISNAAERQRESDGFRGPRAHDFEWLKQRYVARSRTVIPKEIRSSLARVNTWTTSIRYLTGVIKTQEAKAFMASAATIIAWADKRF